MGLGDILAMKKRKATPPVAGPTPQPRPALKEKPVQASELLSLLSLVSEPIPPAPAFLPLSSRPKYQQAEKRLADLEARLGASLTRVRAIDVELLSHRADTDRDAASRMLDPNQPLDDRLGAMAGKGRALAEERGAIEREIRGLRIAVEEGRRNLELLGNSVSAECIPPELRVWRRGSAERAGGYLLRFLAELEAQRALVNDLEDAGISAASLYPTGGGISPGVVGHFIQQLLDTDVLPKTALWTEAAKLGTDLPASR